jgi:hypothetical protein
MGNRSRTGITRREFARRAATAAAATVIPAANYLPSAAALPVASQQLTQQSSLSPESQAEAESRYQTIVSAHGSRLSDSQKADLRRMSIEGQPALDRIRSYHLENSDEPALYLKPLVEREKKSAPPNPASAGAAPAKKS